jgi:hypothetical protein
MGRIDPEGWIRHGEMFIFFMILVCISLWFWSYTIRNSAQMQIPVLRRVLYNRMNMAP